MELILFVFFPLLFTMSEKIFIRHHEINKENICQKLPRAKAMVESFLIELSRSCEKSEVNYDHYDVSS